MSYHAKVYKVFIASPDDVRKEREIVRSVLMRWNAIHAEDQQMVLLPVGWEIHAAPQMGMAAQEYINEEILDKCDILIGVFWTRIGSPTRKFGSGTIEEISRHVGARKLAMLYFSQKEIPFDADLTQVQKVRELKDQYKDHSLYGEFKDEKDLEIKLYNHIQIKMLEGKFRPTFDSDNLAKIQDDKELVKQIEGHFPLVSKNLVKIILDESRSDEVWQAIVRKLSKSPADLRDTLLYLAKRGAFRHKVFMWGYPALAKCSQADFGNFISELYSINRYEFYDIYGQGLLPDSPFARRLDMLIQKEERKRK